LIDGLGEATEGDKIEPDEGPDRLIQDEGGEIGSVSMNWFGKNEKSISFYSFYVDYNYVLAVIVLSLVFCLTSCVVICMSLIYII